MGAGRIDEFRKQVMRTALTKKLSWRQSADDLGGQVTPTRSSPAACW